MAGRKILLVEDEALIAMMAEDMLGAIGCTLHATATTVPDALAAVDAGGFDMALLDIDLGGESSLAVAGKLQQRGCPFAFTTGFGADGVAREYRDVPVLGKPYSIAELERVILALA